MWFSSFLSIHPRNRMGLLPCLLLGLPLLLAACRAVNEDHPDQGSESFALSGCLGPSASIQPLKTAAAGASDTASGLRVLYLSADSLRFLVPFQTNCGLEYAFAASLPTPDTLAIASRVTGGQTAKCTCRKDLSVSFTAGPGQALDKVKAVKVDETLFLDFH